MKLMFSSTPRTEYSGNPAECVIAGAAAASPRLSPRRHGAARKFLITIKVDVVDAHFAGLNTIHYLLKVWVFDLQSIADQ